MICETIFIGPEKSFWINLNLPYTESHSSLTAFKLSAMRTNLSKFPGDEILGIRFNQYRNIADKYQIKYKLKIKGPIAWLISWCKNMPVVQKKTFP